MALTSLAAVGFFSNLSVPSPLAKTAKPDPTRNSISSNFLLADVFCCSPFLTDLSPLRPPCPSSDFALAATLKSNVLAWAFKGGHLQRGCNHCVNIGGDVEDVLRTNIPSQIVYLRTCPRALCEHIFPSEQVLHLNLSAGRYEIYWATSKCISRSKLVRMGKTFLHAAFFLH